MENKPTEILIVTRILVLQQGLSALLKSMPGIANIKAINDLSNACLWIELHAPRIVLLDVALLGSDHRHVLKKIQNLSPDTQRILLVDGAQEANLVPQYAEAMLIKGAAPAAVTAIVTNLLTSKGVEHERNHSNS